MQLIRENKNNASYRTIAE
ncbi:unnamed protein product, partial [Adineta steineri]